MNQKLVKSNDIRNAIRFAPSEVLFKFLVLGDHGVGKTSIVRRYTAVPWNVGTVHYHFSAIEYLKFLCKSIQKHFNTFLECFRDQYFRTIHCSVGLFLNIFTSDFNNSQLANTCKFSPNYKITIGAEFALKRINWDHNTRINLQLWDIAGHERFGSLTRVYYKYSVAAAIVFDLSRIETLESVEKWLTDLRSKVTLPNGDPLPVVLLANKCDVAMADIPTEKINELCKKYNIMTWFMTSAKENSNIDEAVRCLLQKVMDNRNNESYNSDDNILLTEQNIEKKVKSACCR